MFTQHWDLAPLPTSAACFPEGLGLLAFGEPDYSLSQPVRADSVTPSSWAGLPRPPLTSQHSTQRQPLLSI